MKDRREGSTPGLLDSFLLKGLLGGLFGLVYSVLAGGSLFQIAFMVVVGISLAIASNFYTRRRTGVN